MNKTILHIKSSARSIETGSYSRLYGQKLIEKLKKNCGTDLKVIERDLMIKKPLFMNQVYIDDQNYRSLKKSEMEIQELHSCCSKEELSVIEMSNEIIEEWREANEIILECPMYNFSLPGNLKAYFDLLLIINKTFTSDYKGLMLNKKIYIICARSGSGYEDEKINLNFQTAFLKVLLDFIGVKKEEMNFLFIEKTAGENIQKISSNDLLSSL
jgi:FMN-dependent NADH-azoreductase